MPRRNITISPYNLPGDQSDAPVEIWFELVNEEGRKIDGYRSEDNEGIIGKSVYQIDNADIVVPLTQNSKIYPESKLF